MWVARPVGVIEVAEAMMPILAAEEWLDRANAGLVSSQVVKVEARQKLYMTMQERAFGKAKPVKLDRESAKSTLAAMGIGLEIRRKSK